MPATQALESYAMTPHCFNERLRTSLPNERIHLLNTAWAALVLLAVLGTAYIVIGVTGQGIVPIAIGIAILGLALAVLRIETAR